MTEPAGGDVPAGWFSDPAGKHRLRYWDGDRWTPWVADDQVFLDELADPDLSLAAPVAPLITLRERRYWAHLMVIGAPIFLFIWGYLVLFALTHGGTQAGRLLGTVWVLVAVLTLRQPYAAELRPDGSLTFMALTRRVTTTADAVHRIGIVRTRGVTYVFYFDVRKASLGQYGGEALSNHLRNLNSAIQGPSPS